jgi:negative regulator of flagellin synthesis FlgM
MNIKPNTSALPTVRETSPRNGLSNLNKTTDAAATQTTSNTSSTSTTRTINLSPLAGQLQQVEQALNKSSSRDIDNPKVEQLRNAIQNGDLKMDPTRIANGLLQSVRDLFSS